MEPVEGTPENIPLRWPDPNRTSKVGTISWPIRPDGTCYFCGVKVESLMCDCPIIQCGWDSFRGDREAWKTHQCEGQKIVVQTTLWETK